MQFVIKHIRLPVYRLLFVYIWPCEPERLLYKINIINVTLNVVLLPYKKKNCNSVWIVSSHACTLWFHCLFYICLQSCKFYNKPLKEVLWAVNIDFWDKIALLYCKFHLVVMADYARINTLCISYKHIFQPTQYSINNDGIQINEVLFIKVYEII